MFTAFILLTLLTVVGIAVFVMHANYKKNVQKQIELLEGKFTNEDQLGADQASFIGNSKDTEEIKSLLSEIKILHQEKDQEMELRLQAQNQIDLALQKTKDIQKRMEDWKAIQDASIEDARNAISDLGDKLYRKLAEELRDIKEDKALIVNLQESMSLILNKFGLSTADITTYQAKSAPEEVEYKKSEISKPVEKTTKNSPDSINKASELLKSLLESNNFVYDQDFFFAINIGGKEGSKPLIIDAVLIEDQERASNFDFKLLRYIEEYKATGALEVLNQRIDKLITYLENEKLKNIILKWVSKKSGVEITELHTILPVLSDDDVNIIAETGYDTRLDEAGIEILNIEAVI